MDILRSILLMITLILIIKIQKNKEAYMITPSDKKLYRDAIHAIETMDENDPLRKTLIWWCNTHQDVRMGLFEEKNIYEVKYAFGGKCIGRKEYQCEIFCKENFVVHFSRLSTVIIARPSI